MIGVSLANLNCTFSMFFSLEIPRNKLNFSRNCTLPDFSVFFIVCRHFADKKISLHTIHWNCDLQYFDYAIGLSEFKIIYRMCKTLDDKELIKKLLAKSNEAFVLAIEIFNKPTISYRVDGFSFFICKYRLAIQSKFPKNYWKCCHEQKVRKKKLQMKILLYLFTINFMWRKMRIGYG